jgi:uncharacterized protein (TIGR02444 family)
MVIRINSSEKHMNQDQAWQFAVQQWEAPGEAARLLRAQDELGLDVVLHLFARWVAHCTGAAPDAKALAQADALVRAWRDEVIAPLRALRRATNEKPAPGAGWEDGSAAVHRLLKEAELRAERAQLDALCRWWAQREQASP